MNDFEVADPTIAPVRPEKPCMDDLYIEAVREAASRAFGLVFSDTTVANTWFKTDGPFKADRLKELHEGCLQRAAQELRLAALLRLRTPDLRDDFNAAKKVLDTIVSTNKL